MATPYLVGIDLGTTHTVVAYASQRADRTGAPGKIQVFDIAQQVGPGEVAALALLPSVRYHPAPGELATSAHGLPWPPDSATDPAAVLGQLARQLGAQVPGRLVSSAKSWLSHAGVDRLAPILPWGAPPEVPKVSPVAASASYLRHVRAAWNTRFPASPLEAQDLVLTVPASFDEAARALTLQAARDAGLPTLRLLEEPQAAFYDWLLRHRTRLAKALGPTRLVLVCDVGGGTTDFSLIQVDWQDSEPRLTRIGVGKHLMLGGDNMDLALAHLVEARLNADTATPARLSASQMAQLMERCRHAKEHLLAADAPESVKVTLLGSGARLVGGSRSVTLSRTDVLNAVLEGYFPTAAASDTVQAGRAGLVAFGLPYARDAAITRHLADFLRQHASAIAQALGDTGGPLVPDALLLNGGVFRARALAERLEHTLAQWRGAPLHLLHNDNPDVAVARGAVAYTQAQRGLAPRIGGGAARSYYLLLEDAGTASDPRGICLLPRGTEPGQAVLLADRQFALRLGQPVRFHLLSALSHAQHTTPHHAGDLVTLTPEHFSRLPPIATVLQADAGNPRQTLPVQLLTTLTEVGTLELHCVSVADSTQRWKLEFDLRHPSADADAATPDPDEATAAQRHSARLAHAVAAIERIYGASDRPVPAKDVRQLRQQLEKILGERERWGTAELRPLADALWQRARGRRRSPEHERVWLNLLGYTLRPGFGDPLDNWRLQQLWSAFPQGVQHAQDKQVCAEWWTLWRRVAGGLGAPEQLRLLDDFAHNLHLNADGDDAGGTPPVAGSDDDMLRLGASLEHIPVAYKAEIGAWLLGRLHPTASDPATLAADARALWALSRIGARQPFYGHLHDVVPSDTVADWLSTLLTLDWKHQEAAAFAATQLARVTNDRTRDLPPDLRDTVIQRLQAQHAPAVWVQMVQEHVELDEATERRLLGETLPPGLKLI